MGYEAMRPADRTTDDQDELFDVVNEDDEVIDQARRGTVHGDPALIHRSVQILIFNSKGELLLQRRSSTKDLFPGYYCASASGHVASGDDYATTASREVREELGVALTVRYVGKTIVRSEPETEMTAVFIAQSDGPFQFNPIETEGGVFLPLAEVVRRREDGSLALTPAFLAALDVYLSVFPPT